MSLLDKFKPNPESNAKFKADMAANKAKFKANFDSIKEKQREHQEQVAETKQAQGNKLVILGLTEYMGGYGEHKANRGMLTFYENIVEFKVALSSKNSFTLDNKDIADITFDGKDEYLQQRTITRNILLAGKSKKQEVKDGYIVIALTNGQEVMFHVKDKSPMELKAKLSGVVARVKQGKSPVTAASSQTQGNDVVGQIAQLAKLKEQGILTEVEFTAKKKQLLGL